MKNCFVSGEVFGSDKRLRAEEERKRHTPAQRGGWRSCSKLEQVVFLGLSLFMSYANCGLKGKPFIPLVLRFLSMLSVEKPGKT